MSLALRDYQIKAIEDLRAHIRAGYKRLLLVAPTGSGKPFASKRPGTPRSARATRFTTRSAHSWASNLRRRSRRRRLRRFPMPSEPRCNISPAEVDELRERIAALTAERDGLAAALQGIHEGACRQLAEPRNHDDDQSALTAIATVAEGVDFPAILAARDERMRQEGSVAMLLSIRAAVKAYPHGGCDLEIAESLDGIKRQGAVEAKTELLEESLAGLNAQGALVNGEDIWSICAEEIRRRIAALKGGE